MNLFNELKLLLPFSTPFISKNCFTCSIGSDADGLPTLGDQGAVGGGELCYGLFPALHKELSKAHVDNLTEISQSLNEGKPPQICIPSTLLQLKL